MRHQTQPPEQLPTPDDHFYKGLSLGLLLSLPLWIPVGWQLSTLAHRIF